MYCTYSRSSEVPSPQTNYPTLIMFHSYRTYESTSNISPTTTINLLYSYVYSHISTSSYNYSVNLLLHFPIDTTFYSWGKRRGSFTFSFQNLYSYYSLPIFIKNRLHIPIIYYKRHCLKK